MDVGYVALLVLAGLIALAVLWGVFRISPLALLRIAFPYPLYDRRDRLAPDEPRHVAPAHLDAPAPPSAGLPQRLGMRPWLRLINDRTDEAPHLFLYGPTGSGKTLLAQVIAGDRGDDLCIIDPKPPRPGEVKWGGLPYVMIDDDGGYTAIDTALRQVRAEGNRRLAAMKAGTAPATPLTIILDEYKTLARVCPDSAPALFLFLSDIGRELGMRLIVLSQSRLVKSLGIAGQGDTRDNFVEIVVDKQHRAMLTWDGSTYMLDTTRVAEVAARPLPHSRHWSPVRPNQHESLSSISERPTSSQLRSRLDSSAAFPQDMLRPVATRPDNRAETDREYSEGSETHFQAQESDNALSLPVSAVAEIAQIAAAIARGKGKTEILKGLPGYSGRRHQYYSALYHEVHLALNASEKD
jgi:hypothetical protein